MGLSSLLMRRYELMLAVRYLLTKRKQTFIIMIPVISMAGVAVGVAALIIGLSLATGIHEEIRARIIGANAHVSVFAPPGEDEMQDYEKVEERILAVPGVLATAPVLFEKGLMVSEVDPSGTAVFLKGIETHEEQRVTEVAARFTQGHIKDLDAESESGIDSIALGKDLARGLGVGLGDRVRILVPRVRLSPWGVSSRRRTFSVVGIVDSGFFDYDSSWAFVSRRAAQRLLGVDDVASVIEVRVQDISSIASVREAIASSVGEAYPVTDMIQMNHTFFSALRTEKLLTFLVIGLVVLVAALNIVSTLVLIVMEKVRDIGTLVSMGATTSRIMRLFMAQGLFIGVSGTVLGCAGGLSIAWFLDAYRVIPLPAEVYFIPYVPFHVRPLDVALVALTSVGVSFLATIYPARKAARLDPVEALRHE